jgi:ABC-type multidrug transport system permease subunit
MNLQINRVVFKHEFQKLLWNPVTWAQLLFFHAYAGYFMIKAGLGTFSPENSVLSNYILFFGSAILLLLNSISAGYVFVRPKMYRVIDILLATPLSLNSFVYTSIAVCFAFNSVNFLVHMAIVLSVCHQVPGVRDYIASLIALGINLLTLLLGAYYTLQSKNPSQYTAVMVLLSIMLLTGGVLAKSKLHLSGSDMLIVLVILLIAIQMSYKVVLRHIEKEIVITT